MPESVLNRRQTLLWGLFDFSLGRGLEVGPLHSTAVPRGCADVHYLDVFDRDQLVKNYRDDPGVATELIPEVDFALFDGDRVRSIPEAVGSTEAFEWVMASHVIEHVPDVIGWLAEIADITNDGGALVLAVPDRRYCFDLHRPGTSLGQMLQAHELGERVPSVRAVYDYTRGHASVRAPKLWSGEAVGYENRIYSMDFAQAQTDRARRGEYIDSHVWLFTPGSFLEQVVELRNLGLSAWRVERLVPTRRDELEFYVVLRRLPRSGDWPALLFADEPVPATMPDWLAESTCTVQELARVQADGAELRHEVAELRTQRDAAVAEARRLRKQLKSARTTASRQREQDAARLSSRVRVAASKLPGSAALLGARRRFRGRRSL